jgi:pyrroline-5-carboxylate reductase
MKNGKIGCIGCGVMGSALIKAVIKQEGAKNVMLFDADTAKAQQLASETGAAAASSNQDIAQQCSVIFLAVKPQYIQSVFNEIGALDTDTLLVSMAAGVKIETLASYAHCPAARIVRLMPNIPALVGEAMIALSTTAGASAADTERVKAMLAPAGIVEQVPENLMDVVTAVSGSGPAYAFMFIEALADAAVGMGMPRAQAYVYAAQTLKGAAAMMLETKKHPAELKDSVCSPAGTTIAAVQTLEQTGFRTSVIQAAKAAFARSIELGKK